MSHTATRVLSGGLPYRIVGAQKETITDITWTSNYATGGEAVPASELGLGTVHSAEVAVTTPDAESTAVAGVYASDAVKLNTAAAEIANALAITGLVARVTARGTGSAS